MKIMLPSFSVLLLVGPAGCGKSEFAARHFPRRSVFTLYSNLQERDLDSKFRNLLPPLERHLATTQLAVVDAPFLHAQHRQMMTELAWSYGALPCALCFEVPAAAIKDPIPAEATISVGQQIERFQQVFAALQQESFARIDLLQSRPTIDEATVEIITDFDHPLYLGWAWDLSERYNDQRNAYTDVQKAVLRRTNPLYFAEALEQAAALALDGTASDYTIRIALPILLDEYRFQPDMLRVVVKSSARWLPEEQARLHAYWKTLWIEILSTGAAADIWEWGMPALAFLREMPEPKPFLNLWSRYLKRQSRTALLHLVNTLLNNDEVPPIVQAWLRQPGIARALQMGYLRYEATHFATRIAIAERKLTRLIE